MDVKTRVPIDRGWAWMIVLGYFVSIFCMVGIAKSFGILLEEFTAYFDIPVAVAALIMGMSGGMYTLAAPICVAAGTHFTQRRVVMLGGLIGSLGLSLSCLLFNIEWVIFTFGALFGFGNACIFGNGIVMLGQYFVKRRSLANGLSLSGASIGQFAIPPLLQYLLDTYSLQGTLLIIGGIYLNVIVCGAIYRPTEYYIEPQEKKQKEEKLLLGDGEPSSWTVGSSIVKNPKDINRKETSVKGGAESQVEQELLDQTAKQTSGSVNSLHPIEVEMENGCPPKREKKHLLSRHCSDCQEFFAKLLDFRILRSYIVLLFVALSFLIFFGHFNFILFMPPSASSLGITKYEKASLVSVTGICDLFGRILVGVAGDLNVVPRYKLMAGATFGCSLSILAFTFAKSFWPMAVFVGLYGFFGGCYVAINAPVLIDFVGLMRMPKVLGVVLFIQGLGAAFGQPCLGAIRDAMGTYNMVNYIASITVMGGSLLLMIYPYVKRVEDRRNKAQDPYDIELPPS